MKQQWNAIFTLYMILLRLCSSTELLKLQGLAKFRRSSELSLCTHTLQSQSLWNRGHIQARNRRSSSSFTQQRGRGKLGEEIYIVKQESEQSLTYRVLKQMCKFAVPIWDVSSLLCYRSQNVGQGGQAAVNEGGLSQCCPCHSRHTWYRTEKCSGNTKQSCFKTVMWRKG